MSVPPHVTRAVLEGELPPARSLADRLGWSMSFDSDRFLLEFGFAHSRADRRLLLLAAVDGYKALPPAWRFLDPATRAEGKAAWPAPGSVAGKSSIFHNKPVLCAPFNRLAYSIHDGPHNDWGGPEAWLSVNKPDQVRAVTIAEMMQVIRLHVSASQSMMP